MGRQKDFFNKLPTAKGSEGGVHFEPDHHFKVAVVKVIDKEGRSDDHFIVEARVLFSTCPKQGEGFCASQVTKLSNDSAPGNVADFLRAAYQVFSEVPENGLEPLDATNDDDWEELEDMYHAACNEDEEVGNILEGIEVYLKTKGIMTKGTKSNPSHPFTIHDWYPERPDSWPTDENEEED